jgi:hypothetical protein
MRVAGQLHAPATLRHGKMRYPLYRKVGRAVLKSAENLAPTMIRTPDCLALKSPYTDWAIPAHHMSNTCLIIIFLDDMKWKVPLSRKVQDFWDVNAVSQGFWLASLPRIKLSLASGSVFLLVLLCLAVGNISFFRNTANSKANDRAWHPKILLENITYPIDQHNTPIYQHRFLLKPKY